MANFLIYPLKTMRITQNYNGTTSHKPHSTGNPKDYPLDEGADDGGRSWMYCPCDEMKVVKTSGVDNGYANAVWLTSTSKVIFADGTSDYVTILCIHPEDEDLRGLVGKVFKRKEKMFREGGDGGTVKGKHVQYGNHIHMAVGKGKISGSGWVSNSKGKWVLTTTNGAMKPELAFAVDKDFTKVVKKAGLSFKSLAMVEKAYKKQKEKAPAEPTPISKYSVGDYKVTGAKVLNVRKGAGLTYGAKKFEELTPSAQAKIKKLNGAPADGYVKGLTFTVSKVTYNKTDKMYWGHTPSGWVALKYCRKV